MLSFQQAPPLSVPLRFFLTAPLFGAGAGLVLLWLGPQALLTRWAPSTVALTHLMTVGFMLQVMCGALLQFVPVAAGGNVWRPKWIAGFVHPTTGIAAALFAAGFLSSNYALLDAASVLFVISLGVFGLAIGLAVTRTPASSPTVMAIRFAVGGLIATVVLGAILVKTIQGGTSFPLHALTDVHAAWGLAGWGLMLLMGVSFFVVPMFQMTPPYPKRLQRYLPPLLMAVLVLWSIQLWMIDAGRWKTLVLVLLVVCGSVFAGVTLFLQEKRKRKVTDPTFQFFRGAMLCVLAASASWALLGLAPESTAYPDAALWIGVLIVPGLFASVIIGMLYKIVPFVIWLDLQKLDASQSSRLNTRMVLSETAMRYQMYLHFTALLVLLAALVVPVLTRTAGILLVLSYAWLGWNLVAAVRAYTRLRGQLHQTAPLMPPQSAGL